MMESNPMVARLGTTVVGSREERTMMGGAASSRLRSTSITTPPSATLVATRARTIVGAAVATLRGVFRRSLLSGVHGSMRVGACHFSHTGFFQSEHGVECRKRVTLANQGGNTAVSFWKTRYHLKNQTVIVDWRADISKLVREHLKTLTVSRDIRKILHASVGKLLLKNDSTSVLIVLENICQTIPCFHCNGVGLQNSGQEISRNGGINPLKNGGIKSRPLFMFGVGNGWWLFPGKWDYMMQDSM